jgi:hypothetical protein
MLLIKQHCGVAVLLSCANEPAQHVVRAVRVVLHAAKSVIRQLLLLALLAACLLLHGCFPWL